jgi:hypothetical protein
MICLRKVISGLIGFLLFGGIVYADMVPVCKLNTERQTKYACDRTKEQCTPLSCLCDTPTVADLDFGMVRFLPRASADIEQPDQVPHAIELTDGPGSASLCLYALMSLGLFSAPHWIKKLHIGHIPEWYHNGGPFQIGHSFAVSPESLCSVPVYCFVQPNDTAERLIPQYRLRTIVSSWRKSQFTPDLIASRGPPLS